MGFLDPVRPGDDSVARDSNGVCPVCDERVATGEEVRWEVRRLAPPKRSTRTIPTDHRPRWVHAECYQDGGLQITKQPRP